MSMIYQHSIKVSHQDIDELNHVNNEVYLKWILKAATAHSQSLGYGIQKFLDAGAVFVVRRHELEYLYPAFLNEELVVETWLSTFEIMKTIRECQIKRKSDDKVILKAKTLWVYIDLKTGRPKQIPQEMLETYRPYLKPTEKSELKQ